MKKGLKQKFTAKTATKRGTLWDSLPKNNIERLELMIQITEKYIVPGQKDDSMAAQAIRLKARLKELKKTKS